MFEIKFYQQFSLGQLTQFRREGLSVARSAHVGNQYPSNILLALSGAANFYLYDRTVGEKDVIYRPHQIVVGGEATTVAPAHVLATHKRVHVDRTWCEYGFVAGSCVASLHTSAFRSVLNGTDNQVLNYSEYLKSNRELILKIIDSIFEGGCFLGEWKRFVDKSGVVHELCASTWQDIRKKILSITSFDEGWIFPNILNIIVMSTVEAVRSGKDTVFHIAGTGMNYVRQYEEELNSMYAKISGKFNLPEKLTFVLLHNGENRFIIPSSQRDDLENLLTCYGELKDFQARKGDFFSGLGRKPSKEEIAQWRGEEKQVFSALRGALKTVPGLFYKTGLGANHFTQYDLLRNGGAYVHPWASEKTLAEIDAIMVELRRLAGKPAQQKT